MMALRLGRRIPLHSNQYTPLKLTYPLKRNQFKRKFIFQPSIFRGYVSFQGDNAKKKYVQSRVSGSFPLRMGTTWEKHQTVVILLRTFCFICVKSGKKGSTNIQKAIGKITWNHWNLDVIKNWPHFSHPFGVKLPRHTKEFTETGHDHVIAPDPRSGKRQPGKWNPVKQSCEWSDCMSVWIAKCDRD